MNHYYDEIMQLKEAEEFKTAIRKWHTLSGNLRETPMNVPIVLPDMLWIAKSGVGRTKLLRLMSEYLVAQKNLMDFYGDVKFFEFLLAYCSPDLHFTELQRLIDEVRNAAGFRSEYKGILHIDVDEWLDHYTERHFVSFMEFLASHSNDWLVVLSVTTVDHPKLRDFEAFVSMFLRIERITLSLPKTEDLFEYIDRRLRAYGLTLDDTAKDLLSETIEVLRKNKYFDGYKTLQMLCQDIVYNVFSAGKVNSYLLSEADLQDFKADSEYVKRTVVKIEAVKKIGF